VAGPGEAAAELGLRHSIVEADLLLLLQPPPVVALPASGGHAVRPRGIRPALGGLAGEAGERRAQPPDHAQAGTSTGHPLTIVQGRCPARSPRGGACPRPPRRYAGRRPAGAPDRGSGLSAKGRLRGPAAAAAPAPSPG